MTKTAKVLPLAALALGLSGLCSTGAAVAAAPPSAREASIAFANHGGVTDWRADGVHAVYFRDQHNQWFRADLLMPAYDLPYADAIGIDSSPAGQLDRFGAVIVRGERYPFTSFVPADGPPAKLRRK